MQAELGIDKEMVPKLLGGQMKGFSDERLVRFLSLLHKVPGYITSLFGTKGPQSHEKSVSDFQARRHRFRKHSSVAFLSFWTSCFMYW